MPLTQKFLYFLILITVCLFLPSLSSAKEKSRPKIGLVLGGGGARGTAHIGVLKVLEENQIPIAFIAGTSMGSIIGGSYAAGLSPQEIEDLILSIDWKEMMSDSVPRNELFVRDKLGQRKFIGLEFGIKGSDSFLPQGFIAGQNLEFLFQSISLHTRNIENFDQLPIPFRTIATNIVTGEEVILKKGLLADAIRASMAIPGIFAPEELNGQLLVDGYVVNNVPIDVAQAMGADIIIAVDVTTPLKPKSSLKTLFDIMKQETIINTQKNVQEQIARLNKRDILIQPDLGDMTSTDYSRCAEGIKIGEEAARKLIDQLKQLSASNEAYQTYLSSQRKTAPPLPTIDFIEIAPLKKVSKKTVRPKIKTKIGSPLDLNLLQKDINRIQSSGNFEKVTFSLIDKEDHLGVLFKAKEKSWGPNYLHFGLNAVSDFEGDNYYNALIDLRFTQLNDLGAEWKNQVQLGKNSKILTEFYQPLTYENSLFVAPVLQWEQDIVDIYEDHDRLAEYRSRMFGGGIDIGANFGTQAEMRGGLFLGTMEAVVSTGSADLPEFDIDRAAYRLQFVYDQLDTAFFPKKGLLAKALLWMEREELGGQNSFETISLDAAYAKTFSKHTFIGSFSAVINPDEDIPFYAESTLGGFLSLSGFQSEELRGKQQSSLMLIYYYRFLDRLTSLIQGAYIGCSLEGGQVGEEWKDVQFSKYSFGGSGFLGLDTLAGSLYFGYGQNEDSDDGRFYFYLGQIF